MTQIELFKVYEEPQEATQATPCMFAYLHTTAYALQAWDYGADGIKVELSFKEGDDTDALENDNFPVAWNSRDKAIICLDAWGKALKKAEEREGPGMIP